jgi:RNAse (barnase) inhibitor barstar
MARDGPVGKSTALVVCGEFGTAARDTRCVTRVYVLDGGEIDSLEAFWRVIGEAVNGRGGYFGRNLDALNDCLNGGFGTPADDDYVFEWRDHRVSRDHLDHAETVRQLRLRLARCHPESRARVRAELDAASAGAGPTVFDWLVKIIGDDHGKLRLA